LRFTSEAGDASFYANTSLFLSRAWRPPPISLSDPGGIGRLQINWNIAANYASRLWGGISTFVFAPLYLRILGPEAFGLITFSTTLLGIVFIVDMGLSNTFAREMARTTDKRTLADLLRSLEWVYVGIILLFLLVAELGSV
jgi:hypothetical protein